MNIKINNANEYKLYLKKQLGQYVKDDKKLQGLVDEFYLAFSDGIKLGQGRLEVEV